MSELMYHAKSTVEKVNIPNTIVTVFGTLITFISEQYTHLVWAFFLAVFLDLISGMVRGWYQKQFSSRRMRETIVKLFFYLSVMTMIVVLGKFNPDIGKFLVPVQWFCISIEVTSMLENGRACGVNFGGKVFDKLFAHFETKGVENESVQK